MNKLKLTITGLFAMFLSIGVMNAQSGTNMPAKPATKAPATKAPAKKATTAKAKTATTKVASGTAAKPAQHLKKDGTPDMRYKENKAAAGKTSAKKATGTKTATKPATKPATKQPAAPSGK